MGRPNLRSYQIQDIDRLNTLLGEGVKGILYQLPVGGGKTVVLAEVIRQARLSGKRVLFIAHRRELIWQAQDKLRRLALEPRIIMGTTHVPLGDENLILGTIQSVISSRRLQTLGKLDVIVIDEAHHATAPSYLKLVKLHPTASIIGMTATPIRRDGRGLGHLFGEIVQGPTIPTLIEMSYLVEPKYFAPHTPDMKGVRIRAGDYVDSDLERLMDKPKLVGDIYEWWYRLARERPTIIFASGVKHSIHIASLFKSAGIAAEHVDGSTPHQERDVIFNRFRAGDVQVLVNCDVATEGTDLPQTSAIVVARPTKSLVRWVQMVGRGLRTAENKQDCLVLDHSGTVFNLGFIEDWSEWTLDKGFDQKERQSSKKEPSSVILCPTCKEVFQRKELVHSSAGIFCPACTAQIGQKRLGRDVETEQGDLARVTRNGQFASLVDKQRYYAQLLYIQRERGYKVGWVAHRFKVRFKEWPPYNWQNTIEPQVPTFLKAIPNATRQLLN